MADMRRRVETDMRTMVEQLVAAAADEQEQAVRTARQTALEEGAQNTRRLVGESEARMQTVIDQVVTEAREQERQAANQRVADAALASATQLETALADAQTAARQALHDSVSAARVRERELESVNVGRLLDGIRSLDAAASLSEVLDALGRAVTQLTGRSAVLILRSDRLVGWALQGFGAYDGQPKTVDLGLNEGGIIAAAIETAAPASSRDHVSAGPPAFAQAQAGFRLAAPVIVGGRVVGVVYTEEGAEVERDDAMTARWPILIELLTRHAARCLEAVTVQRTAAPSASRPWVPPGYYVAASPAGHSALQAPQAP